MDQHHAHKAHHVSAPEGEEAPLGSYKTTLPEAF
jgi:hypothetical protein